MKKQLFTLLTLLLVGISSAWGDDTYEYYYNGSSTINTSNYFDGSTAMSSSYNSSMEVEFTNAASATIKSKKFAKLNSSGLIVFTVADGKAATVTVLALSKDQTSDNGICLRKGNTISGDLVATGTHAPSAKFTTYTETFEITTAGQYSIWRVTNENAAVYVKVVETTATNYDITWANGGHGTAPTSPTSASSFTLPTMDADGVWNNTGWTANQIVKVGGVNKTSGTFLAVGTTVTLTAATTFTGVWQQPSTFALTSDAEVEVTIGGSKSQITYENNAGTVTYESANPSVASVDEDGKITAVAGGKTTITVSDPGNATTAAGNATVTVLVPYGNPSAATSYVLNQDTYAFSNAANTKYYFTNGFTIDVTGGTAEFQNGGLTKSKKYSHARTYTINVPGNVTVTYAIFTARNNYKNENSNPAANWGTVFGTDYSSEGNLPWSTETPAEKDFVIGSPSAGGTLVFQPGGNQWQAIINLYTDTYRPKHTVSYVAGDGTGTMTGAEVREGSAFTLSIQGTIAAPAGKYFTGWNDGVKDYAPGDSYTMSTADLTFTAQWATSAEANHYHYGYKDATHYNGTTYTDPTGAAATTDGSTHTLTDGNLCSSLGGITNVAISGAKYDGKTGDLLYMNSYLKIEKGGTAKVTVTIAAGYAGTLRIKAGGYSSNPTLAISNSAVKVSGTVGGVATTENNYNTLVYTLYAGTNEITCTGQNMYITEMDIVTTQTVSGTISASGWNTFSSNYKLDLSTVTGGAAYYASAVDGTEHKVTLTTTDAKVAAGEGLMIKGTAGETFTIGVTNDAATFEGTNLLVGLPNGGTVAKNDNNYVFGWADPASPGFYYINATEPTLAAGKSYLHTTIPLANQLTIDFDDEESGQTTGIAEVSSKKEFTGEYFNLNGQKIQNPTKGLYIVNGKKVIVK